MTNPEKPRPPPRFRWSATQRLRGRRAVAREDVRRSSSVVVPFRWTLGCSARSDPGAPVVPLSLLVSMVVEGHHGNRGLLPSSTRVSLRRRPSCTPPRRVPRPGRSPAKNAGHTHRSRRGRVMGAPLLRGLEGRSAGIPERVCADPQCAAAATNLISVDRSSCSAPLRPSVTAAGIVSSTWICQPVKHRRRTLRACSPLRYLDQGCPPRAG